MITGGVYRPWMSDKRWRYAWEADRGLVDSTSTVGTWSPQKGNLSWTASGTAKPAWSAALGTNSQGILTFDGVNDIMSCAGLTSVFSSSTGYSATCLFKYIVNTNANKTLFSMSNTSNTKNYHVLGIDGSTPTHLFFLESGDGGTPVASRRDTINSPASDTSWHVLSWVWVPGSPPTTTFYLDDSLPTVGSSTSGTWGTQTLTKASLGGFDGATITQNANIAVRAIMFGQPGLTQAEMRECYRSLHAQTL